MTNSIIKAASLMSTLARAQKVGYLQSCRNVFYSPTHFPKVLGAIMVSGVVGGYCIMDTLHSRRMKRQDSLYTAAWEANYERRMKSIEGQIEKTPAIVRTFTRRLTRMSVERSRSADGIGQM
jgi:hypothetical protein